MSKVIFKEDTHQYFSGKDEYISVTTLLKKYSQEFDAGYWSTYKAVKDVLEARNEWTTYKISVGGWEKVVAHWNNNPIHLDDVLDRKKYYLDMWESESHNAKVKGKLIHADKEQEIKGHIVNRSNSTGEFLELPMGSNEEGLMVGDFNSEGVYAEVLVWNDQYKVAGMVDKIIKRKKHLDLEDYKTNKKLSTTGFRGEKMKPPLQEFENCSMALYQLQLSLYAWILQQKGYHIGTLTIRHIPDEITDERIQVEYRPDSIEKLLKHYDKRRIFN